MIFKQQLIIIWIIIEKIKLWKKLLQNEIIIFQIYFQSLNFTFLH